MYNYESDADQFLRELVEKNPSLEEQRLNNRGLLWDVTLNPEEQAGFKASSIPKKPYAYQTE